MQKSIGTVAKEIHNMHGKSLKVRKWMMKQITVHGIDIKPSATKVFKFDDNFTSINIAFSLGNPINQ